MGNTTPDDKPTEALTRSLGDMRDKTKQLNESLQDLATQGFGSLAKAVAQAATSSKAATRQPAGDIAGSELSSLLRQELASGIAGIFGGKNGAGGGVNVVINNKSGAAVTAQESGGAFDQKYLEITIDQMVANSLMRGRETGGVLRTLFGLVPSLIGR